ncbi:PEP/pyruvate-binding domain-containing protein [Nocardia mexicana]|uniref:Pyruvate,water dikinase n=1 Tax=Nocardia mexicana TaxID=279262 RepID=A0A370HE01_9NOCA|nr:PEP/pyruvate-binding domain-containing protein [Nocardia mexicana]RDI55275.1 pyruvate,water dikinase [Nocardia mexicana]
MTRTELPETTTTRPELLVLDGAGASGELVGGKAAALDRLIGWHIPVPPAACVTASAYREVAGAPEIEALLARLDRRPDVSTAEIDAAFRRAGLPEELVERITAVAARVGGGGRVAVRSSATVEDMDASSFAGQYVSILDVDPADPAAVERAVLSVFSSLHHPAPRAYRRALGVADEGAAMAALIMPMIPAVRSGVLFTQDPTGPAGTVRIETVHGLADVLVSGRQTPQVLLAPGGTPPAHAAPEIEPLLATARDIERHTGRPQDVEWAWDGSRLWVVQARPITILGTDQDPVDSAPQDLSDREFTTSGIAEMLPGVLAPLRWDICSHLVEEALRSMLDALGTLPQDDIEPPHRLLRRIHGRAALDAALVGAADMSEAAPSRPRDRIAATGHRVRATRARRRACFDADTVIHAADEIYSSEPILDTLDNRALLRYHLALLDLATRAMAAEVIVAADAGAIHQGVRRLLDRYLAPAAAAALANTLTVPAGAVTVRPGASMAIPTGPTWLESGLRPPVPAGSEETGSAESVISALSTGPRWPKPGLTRWLRRRRIERLTTEASGQFERRERAKHAILLLGGEIRRVHLEFGRRFEAAGALPRPSDIQLLTLAEFRSLATGSLAPPPALLDRRRRRLHRQEQLDPLPSTFRGLPESVAPPPPAGARRLEGWAASGGHFRGIARRLTAPGQPLASDEILLAVTTDPSWAPLLMRCGAMVIEQGGPLSHAAILAREFGVPAVFHLPGAARSLDGRRIEVDGDSGTVTILDEGPADEHS